MKKQKMTSCKGLTLVELMVAMGLSLLVLAAAVTLFKNAMDVTNNGLSVIEMQQGARAAFNVMTRDLSVAATGGFPRTGVALPTGGGSTLARYTCDQASVCYLTPNTYGNRIMYPVNVADNSGPNVTGAGPTDGVVAVTVDTTWPCNGMNRPPAAIAADGSSLVVPNPNTPDCIGTPASPLGAAVGDVFMIQNVVGSAVAEVTAVNDGTQTISFGNDSTVLNLNQNTAPVGNIQSLKQGGVYPPNNFAFRLNVVSYFLRIVNGVPILMRQVNGNSPIPVAENIEDLFMTYDLWNTAANPNIVQTGIRTIDQVGPPPQDTNMIRKINIAITARSRRPDPTGQYRRVRLATYVSPRGLSFFDRYN